MAGDVLRDSVVFLMKAEGPNDSVVFTDKSFYPKVVSTTGQAKVATGVGKRGGCSVGGFGANNNNYVHLGQSTEWVFGATTKFTIEFFVKLTAYNAVGGRLLTSGGGFAGYNATTGIHWQIATTSTGIYMEAWNGTTSQSCGGMTLPLNEWEHVAVCYNGAGVFHMYRDGLLVSTTSCTIGTPSTAPFLVLGALAGEAGGNTTQVFDGFVAELRITKGINRYTAPFTPPTGEYPDRLTDTIDDIHLGSVEMLLKVTGTDGSALNDTSATPKTVTAFGGAAASAAQSRYGGSSLRIAAVADKLNVAFPSSLDLSTDSYTIEGFIYLSAVTTGDHCNILATNDSVFPSRWVVDFAAFSNGTASLRIVTPSNTVIFNSTAMPYVVGTWMHFAVVNDSVGNTLRMFLDGNPAGSRAAAGFSSVTTLNVGKNSGAWTAAPYFLDEIRITKGVARYSSAFTPVEILNPVVSPTHDPYLGAVKALYHFNGLSGSTVYNNTGASAPWQATNYGACKLTAAHGPFMYEPGSVVSLDGVDPMDTLSVASSPDFSLGNQDWTIECWFNTTAQSLYTNFAQVFYFTGTGVNLGVRFTNGAGGPITWTVLDGDWARLYGITGSSNVTLKDAWHHLAFTRKGGLCRCFLDGQRMTVAPGYGADGTSVTEWVDTTNIGPLSLSIGHTIKGYIDDFRVTSGYARYVNSFIPQQSNFSLLDPSLDTTTKLLHIFADGADLATTITDSSGYARTILVQGNAAISTTQSKLGGSSLYLDGDGDYITLTPDVSLLLRMEDFTIEAWVFTVDNNFTVMDYWMPTTGFWKWGVNAAGKLVWWQGNSIVLTGSVSVNTGAWKHIAISRMNGNLMFFVDGAMDGQVYAFQDLFSTPTRFAIGGQHNTRDAAQDMVGYIDEVIITKGYAKYFQDFQAGAVVSGDVDPYLANVSLLVDGSSAGGKYLTIYDRSNNARQLGVAGQTKATMDKSRYGLPSIAFDGNGDYITTIESFPDLILNGDFTIECSVMLASTSQNASVLVAKGWPTIPCSSFLFHMTAATNIALFMSSNGSTWDIASNIVMKAGPAANVWYNFAIVRSGNTYNLFEGGRIVATFTSALTPVADAAPVTIGGADDAGACFNGWIDDVRITKGVARYSSRYIIRNSRFPGSTAGEIPVVYKSLSGYVKDVNGNPVGTVVRAYRRDTGALIGEVLSDKTTGIYTISTTYAGKCSIVFLPPTTGYGLNALVLDDMLPV